MLAVAPAEGGVSTTKLWPGHPAIIPIVLCTETAPDPDDHSGCQMFGKLASLDAARTDLVKRAIEHWNNTFSGHVQFQYVTTYQRGVVLIGAPGPGSSGCSTSRAGYLPEYPKTVQIDIACYGGTTPLGTVLHELGHVAGLHHEQRRLDRDDYFVVDTVSMSLYAASCDECKVDAYQWHKLCDINFLVPCPTDFVIPGTTIPALNRDVGISRGAYDPGSIMHYRVVSRPTAVVPQAAVIGLKAPTIAWLQQNGHTESYIGQRDDFSAGDIAAIKEMYP
jgi:hypothetical protein